MSDGPDYELQAAIVPWLKTDAVLIGLIDRRVYDQPPAKPKPKFPYLTVGEAQVVRDDAACIDGQIIYLTLHAWSDEPGFPQVKRLSSAVVDRLHMASLTLTSYRLVSLLHQRTLVLRDADGLTSHGVIEFVANTEKLIA